MRDKILGSIDQKIQVYLSDPAQADMSGKTGVSIADLTVSYARLGEAAVNVTSLLNTLAAVDSLHNDWGWKEISSALMPGWYRLDLADAVLAAGTTEVGINVMLTSSQAAPSPIVLNLVTGDLTSISNRLPASLSGDNLLNVNVMKILNAEPQAAEDIVQLMFSMADTVEVGFNFKNSMRLLTSAMVGLLSGAGTSNVQIKNMPGNKIRITMTVDVPGNRLISNYDLSD